MSDAANQQRELSQKAWQQFLDRYSRDHSGKPPKNKDVIALILTQLQNEPLKEIAGAYILENKPCYTDLSFVAQIVPALRKKAMAILIREYAKSCFNGLPWGLGIPPDLFNVPGLLDRLGRRITFTLLSPKPWATAIELLVWLIPSRSPAMAKLLLERKDTDVSCLSTVCLHAEKAGYDNAVSAAEKILLHFEGFLSRLGKKLSRRTGQTQDCMHAIIRGYMKFVSAGLHNVPEMAELSARYLSAAERAADKIIGLREPNLYSLFYIMDYIPSRGIKAWRTILKQFGEAEIRTVFWRFRRWNVAMGQKRVARPPVVEGTENFSLLAAEIILAKYCRGQKDFNNISAFVPELEERIKVLEKEGTVETGEAKPFPAAVSNTKERKLSRPEPA